MGMVDVMAKWVIGAGLEEYLAQLQDLEENTEDIIKKGIYEGAAVVVSTIRNATASLPVDNGHGTPGHKLNGVTRIQKAGLLDGLGIAPMKEDGMGWNTKIGFDGYNNVKTRKYPGGQPNSLIARSIESGTSFRSPHPFVAPAARKAKAAAEKAMEVAIDTAIEAIVKE